MKKYIAILAVVVLFTSCNQATTNKDNGRDTAFAKAEVQQSPYNSYGAKIEAEGAMKPAEVVEQYAALKEGDTALVKFEAPINSVCAAKGCWMRLDAGEEEVFVKFKDYGFFVPLDATGEAIVEGKAYLEEVSVDELQHMAKDAGKTEAEIAAITAPKRELRFMADGVLIKGK
jgi:hypothetical protein